jgi:PhnB protein
VGLPAFLSVAGGAITQNLKDVFTTEVTEITEEKTGFLCGLCVLCGENAFDPGLLSRRLLAEHRERRLQTWGPVEKSSSQSISYGKPIPSRRETMSDVRLNPYLNFQGNCREAFDFYASVLRAEISFLITMGESPMASEVPPECHNNICHVCLKGEGIVLMGSDCPPDVYEKPQGTIINVQAETAERAEAIFTALSEGGEIRMPMEETFWAERFGMCTDRFGVPWMVNCDKPMP